MEENEVLLFLSTAEYLSTKGSKQVEKRLEFGHFEGDFIESGKDGKGSLLVLVQRKTRIPVLGVS